MSRIPRITDVESIVKEFASEDATVVVGTVIDPEMQDELRVTVVATGLNRVAMPQQHGRSREGFAYRESSRDSGREPAREPMSQRDASMRAGKRPMPSLQSVATDYAGLEKPAVQRFARAVGDGVGNAHVDEELLDIPAFLRRQAD